MEVNAGLSVRVADHRHSLQCDGEGDCQVYGQGNSSIRVGIGCCPRSSAEYSDSDGISRANEGRRTVERERRKQWKRGFLEMKFRFAKNLNVAKKIGVKKGLLMGLCLGVSQVFTFLAFTITFWYGPQLVRTECTTYSAGTVIVVRDLSSILC